MFFLEYKRGVVSRSLATGCILLLSLITAACGSGGGGGGSGNNSGTPSSTAITHSLSGTAIKGVLKNAAVEVYHLTNGQSAELLASGTTDSSGHFNLTVLSDPTDVLVIVKPANDGSSRMLCDALS
ncbi:MAG TPA: hypothetical protein VFM46_16660, partial [Pseudomonadales bacterium]|nr:hypothetical protein [Pseudomonadales bacterium]